MADPDPRRRVKAAAFLTTVFGGQLEVETMLDWAVIHREEVPGLLNEHREAIWRAWEQIRDADSTRGARASVEVLPLAIRRLLCVVAMDAVSRVLAGESARFISPDGPEMRVPEWLQAHLARLD